MRMCWKWNNIGKLARWNDLNGDMPWHAMTCPSWMIHARPSRQMFVSVGISSVINLRRRWSKLCTHSTHNLWLFMSDSTHSTPMQPLIHIVASFCSLWHPVFKPLQKLWPKTTSIAMMTGVLHGGRRCGRFSEAHHSCDWRQLYIFSQWLKFIHNHIESHTVIYIIYSINSIIYSTYMLGSLW